MSITLLANGQRAAVLGVNEQVVGPCRGRPHVFQGVIGPVTLPGRLGTALQGLADRLVQAFGLQGLCGIDFLRQGDELLVLEVNPRPPASLQLYGLDGGLMAAHLEACLHGRLPVGDVLLGLQGPQSPRALGHVLARQALEVTARRLDRLCAWPGVHDVPDRPLQLAAGDPLCTLSLQGAEPQALREQLARATEHLLSDLENLA
jgi:predicted ATP-grasp superfamily ATP-dependent carboligase